MQVSCFAVLLQFIVIKIVTTYTITSKFPAPQIYLDSPQNINQQFIKTLLSSSYNEAKFPERLEFITAAVQQIPQKQNKIYLSDELKKSALQNLQTAAYVCKRNGLLTEELPKQFKLVKRIELPQTKLPSQFDILKRIDLAETKLPSQSEFLKRIDLTETKSPGQYGIVKKIQLPGQLEVQRQIEMRVMELPAKLAGQLMLPGKSELVLPVANIAKEVISNIPCNVPKTIRIQYF